MKSNGKMWLLGVCLLMSKPLFSQNIYLEINLNKTGIQNRIHSMRPKGGDLELFRVIDRAARDNHIRGIILNIASFEAGQETVWELRSVLENFKSHGKRVCAFISSADLDMYCLASVADRIIMDEQGTLALTGYVWGRGYVQHTLEKLGIGVRELRYLEYKSAAETYTRDSMSEADRKQYGEYLDDVFAITRDALLKARSWTMEEFDTILNEEFMYSAKNALSRGLVDRIGRGEALAEVLKEIEGTKVNHFVLYGDTSSSITGSKAIYGPGRAGNIFNRPPLIAVIYANGVTDMMRGMAARSLSRTIREVSEKHRVKAIVLRIDSPGGSAEAADYIAEAVKYARKRIPVVVSMGSVAASGGYWASINASHITASPYTLTGSIGVISSWFYDNGMNSKLGLSVDVLQRGEHADLAAGMILPRRDLNAVEEARYRGYILDMYGDFTAKVATGRGMDIEKVEAAAQGRVYSGTSALNAGLIDSIGGLADAVRIARELAQIPEGIKTAFSEYPKPKFFDRLLDKLPAVRLSRAMAADNGSLTSAAFLADLFISAPLLADIRYRISHNGQVMPILPIENTLHHGR